MALEEPKSTWDKRYKQKHYSYRDKHRATTNPPPVSPAAIAVILAGAYRFGTNARALNVLGGGGIYNWPWLGDPFTSALGCLAREVMVHCTTDAWISLVSVNPYFLIYQTQNPTLTVAQIQALGIPLLLTEEPQFITANSLITFYPTYGYAVAYWHDSEEGTITIWAEGNVEGTE